MNIIKKNITVHFFSIQAEDSFFKEFNANFALGEEARILRQRNKAILLKTLNKNSKGCFFLTAVRERNTWQVKASRHGGMNEITTNQGVIGDPYFFSIIPTKKLLVGFTTGLNGNLKSVGEFLINQFNSYQNKKVNISLIPKEKDFEKLQTINNILSLQFKIKADALSDLPNNAPLLLKQLSEAPYIDSNVQLSLNLDYTDDLSNNKKDIIEIISYLSKNDICDTLKVKGTNDLGQNIGLDFGNAFLNYKTNIAVRSTIIEYKTAQNILDKAILMYYKG